ncbi:MAG: 50S ribosomal protein L19 [Candidatus Vogelbacteria bacterium]|nr:50S ribosomal protein L19 [Candidatus Vogelbacteria bacterium]
MATKTNIKTSSVDLAKRAKMDLRPGNTVRGWQKIQEKGKVRLQAYEGLIIAHKHGSEAGATITVRRVASGVGMEKIFPLYSPNIDKIEILRSAKVRQAKLYYIRDKAAKEIRRRMKKIAGRPVAEKEVDELVAQVVEGIETGDITATPEEAVAEETKE